MNRVLGIGSGDIYSKDAYENGLPQTISGFFQGNMENLSKIIRYMNRNIEEGLPQHYNWNPEEGSRPQELRDNSISPGLNRMLMERNYNNTIRNAQDKDFRAGFGVGELTDIPINAGLGGLFGMSRGLKDAIGAVTPQGREVFMHGSFNAPLRRMKNPYDDFATHFGDGNQAFDRIITNSGSIGEGSRMQGYTMPEDLNLLTMSDSNTWKPLQNLEDIYDRGYISKRDRDYLRGRMTEAKDMQPELQNAILRNFLRKAGYDGFRYKNGFEGDSIRDSIALFEPKKNAQPVDLDQIIFEPHETVPERLVGREMTDMDWLLKKYFNKTGKDRLMRTKK